MRLKDGRWLLWQGGTTLHWRRGRETCDLKLPLSSLRNRFCPTWHVPDGPLSKREARKHRDATRERRWRVGHCS